MSRHSALARVIRDLKDRLAAQEEEMAILRGELDLNARVADIVERELDLLGEEVESLAKALAALTGAPAPEKPLRERIFARLMALPALPDGGPDGGQ